jgi:hypothetical protein
VFENVPAAVYEQFGQGEGYEFITSASELDYTGLPIEPMLLMLALTVVFLILAGRIWQEVEA